jgi:hypothetical protein
VRYYRCNGRNQVMDPEQRCRGSLQADRIESRIWAAVERVLQHPEMIAAEVARHEDTAGERRAALLQAIEVIEAGLATCDREARRWAEAYAAEVISLSELQGYRREIGERRQQLQSRHAGLHAEMEAIGQTSGQLEALMNYCTLVRQRLQTFDEREKQLTLEALDIRVTWTPNQPLAIEGSIPLSDIVPVPSGDAHCQAASPRVDGWSRRCTVVRSKLSRVSQYWRACCASRSSSGPRLQ